MDKRKIGDVQKPDATNAIQEKIGEKLKEAYADVLEAPVPDRFLDLLEKLESTDKGRSH